jgi:hypothetical protein
MKVSREHAVEDLKRGKQLEIDLDVFASLDDGVCGCAVCRALRRAHAAGHRGTVRLGVPAELRGKLK